MPDMSTFLSGATGIVSTIFDAVLGVVEKCFNLLVYTNPTTNAVEGPSVAGWFIVLALSIPLIEKGIKFFKSLVKGR